MELGLCWVSVSSSAVQVWPYIGPFPLVKPLPHRPTPLSKASLLPSHPLCCCPEVTSSFHDTEKQAKTTGEVFGCHIKKATKSSIPPTNRTNLSSLLIQPKTIAFGTTTAISLVSHSHLFWTNRKHYTLCFVQTIALIQAMVVPSPGKCCHLGQGGKGSSRLVIAKKMYSINLNSNCPA